MVTYIAKAIEKIENQPGAWNSIRVGVFRVEGDTETQIGEYVRNYPTLFRTFCHFVKDNKDFALYSPDYTATRVMELPSCLDIGGEERDFYGFCPTDYYVPSFVETETVYATGETFRYHRNEPSPQSLVPYEENGNRSYPVIPLTYYPFGFVSGCVWGDDSTYKIQYLDLREVEKGIIKREEKFGYIAMPEHLTLKQTIDISGYDDKDDSYDITIAIQKRFDLRTGKMVDE
jgi:hypothetical protein